MNNEAGFWAGLLLGIMLAGGVGLFFWSTGLWSDLEQCRRDNNVFACRLVAVPITSEELAKAESSE